VLRPLSSSALRSRPGGSRCIATAAATLRIVVLSALSYLIALTGIAMFQNHLLYFPDQASVAEMVSGGLSPWPTR
jgi:hypothetical protein